MAERASTEEKLAALKKLAREPITSDARKVVVSALKGANNILAAEAASFISSVWRRKPPGQNKKGR